MYTWIKIEKTEDFDQLVDAIGQEYNPKKVANTIKSDISAAVRRVLIEHNYADKDYRSTYYNFYSKKGRRYRSSCVRLHFFHEDVEFDDRLYQLSDVNKPFSQNAHVDERFGELYIWVHGPAANWRRYDWPDGVVTRYSQQRARTDYLG